MHSLPRVGLRMRKNAIWHGALSRRRKASFQRLLFALPGIWQCAFSANKIFICPASKRIDTLKESTSSLIFSVVCESLLLYFENRIVHDLDIV